MDEQTVPSQPTSASPTPDEKGTSEQMELNTIPAQNADDDDNRAELTVTVERHPVIHPVEDISDKWPEGDCCDAEPRMESYSPPTSTLEISSIPQYPIKPPDVSLGQAMREPMVEACMEAAPRTESYAYPIKPPDVSLGQAMMEPMVEACMEAAPRTESCALVERAPLLDSVDTGEEKDNRVARDETEKNETTVDATLARGDLDEILDKITPYNLTKCKTNSLEKSLEVSHKLKLLADKNAADAEDFKSLSSKVDDFSFNLLESLKYDDMKRAIFGGEDFDRVAEKIVLYNQKKFCSHPVVYNLILRRWTGGFYRLKNSSWWSIGALKWALLNIWTVFDVVLFPITFLLLYLIHKVLGFVKKRQDHGVVVILNPIWKESKYLTAMRSLTSEIFESIKYDRTMLASIIRRKDGIVINDLAGKKEAKTLVNAQTCRMTTNINQLSSCLKEAKEMLMKSPGIHSNKTIVVLTDVRSEDSRKFIREARRIKNSGFKVISVGFGVKPDIKELESIATDGFDFLFNGDTKQESILRKVVEGIHGYDLFDKYVQYFNTPYFIFMRDTLSYLALLGLHFAICLLPSTLYFTVLEWIIMFFFLGRLLMELYQANMERNSCTTKMNTPRRPLTNKSHIFANDESQSISEDEEEMESEVEIIQPVNNRSRKICHGFINIMSRYLRDWWNGLDLITLIVYVVILVLRCITWAEHITVSGNRLLAISGYLYGLNTMFLTLRVFGHIMESAKNTGSIQIALFQIIGAVVAIFGQFLAAILAFSLAMTKVYIAEMSYNAATNSTSHGFCENRQGGVSCWWRSMTHLIWSVLGISDLGPLESSDETSDFLAKLLYGVFLIMAVVMMMNMMIALLSNTYQQVEDNAFYEWSYRKATTIRTYNDYHPVPVPFNIISLSYMFFRNICKRFCCKDNGKVKNTESTEATPRKTFFDCLVIDLEAHYFASNGYVFPMTESDKMDLVLNETEGSHQLIGHIAHQVFKYNEKDARNLRDTLGNQYLKWDTAGIEIKGHQLNYVPCTCTKCTNKSPDDRHGARLMFSLSQEWPGFEILVQEMGERHFIALGVVTDDHDLHRFPGWEGNTAGFHVDDSKIYDVQKRKPEKRCEGAMVQRGDLIGCKIRFDSQFYDGSLPVSFTRNGRVIGEAKVKGRRTMDGRWETFYPFIGIGMEGISVLFKLCSNEQQYPLKPRDESEELLDKISKTIYEMEWNIRNTHHFVQKMYSKQNELINSVSKLRKKE